MKKNKPPYWIRLIRYYVNSIWYYLLYPVGQKEDDFTKQWNNNK